jgi:uncharacterized protein YcbX
MLKISELYIYPVKSLGGIKIDKGYITDRGFQHDRRWMLVDINNQFISQREAPQLALLKVDVLADSLKITHKASPACIIIPFEPLTNEFAAVTIWDDVCTGQFVSTDADKWFTEMIKMKCRLVYMPDDTLRLTNPKYTPGDNLTSFSDAFPFMIIGQASLDDLNNRLLQPLPINRFRPNIVFTGGRPYQEDIMDEFTINKVTFNGVKLCARCIITTTDQDKVIRTQEPLKTLATYRFRDNNVYLGQNLINSGLGHIAVGDEICIINEHTGKRFII